MRYDEQLYPRNEGLEKSSKDVITLLPIQSLTSFYSPTRKNPFLPYTDEKMTSLEQSIAQIGLQQPIIVKQRKEREYCILSGYIRTQACKNLGWDQIPAILQNVSDDQAAKIAVQSNFEQRGELLHSEKARGYRAMYPDVSGEFPVGTEDSRTQVYRYLKLNELLPELLSMVDTGEISFQIGVEIACFDPMEQALIYEFFYVEKRARLTLKMIQNLHRMSKRRKICQEDLDGLSRVTAIKPNEAGVSIPYNRISELYETLPSDEELCEFILDLLKLYANNEVVREAFAHAA